MQPRGDSIFWIILVIFRMIFSFSFFRNMMKNLEPKYRKIKCKKVKDARIYPSSPYQPRVYLVPSHLIRFGLNMSHDAFIIICNVRKRFMNNCNVHASQWLSHFIMLWEIIEFTFWSIDYPICNINFFYKIQRSVWLHIWINQLLIQIFKAKRPYNRLSPWINRLAL